MQKLGINPPKLLLADIYTGWIIAPIKTVLKQEDIVIDEEIMLISKDSAAIAQNI